MADEREDRLEQLLGYLEMDPDNPMLLADASRAALDAGMADKAEEFLSRLQSVTPGAIESDYLSGLLMMHRGDFADAAARFESVLARSEDPATRFNLAWSRAMIGEKIAALALLEGHCLEAISSAAMLRVQLLHEGGQFDLAFEDGKAALERFPDDCGLLGAMATLALDVEEIELARYCAYRAGSHPEGLAAVGVLELRSGDVEAARKAFDRAIALREHNPRAWLGRGLASLLERDTQSAASDLDRGAQQFGDHIGSWIAAGWARYLSGDIDGSALRFERALAIDPAFAETHGSLAVIDVARGDPASARRRTATALRLDKESFSAALAQSLLSSDDPARASEIIEHAMSTPIDGATMTLAGYLSGLSRPTLH